MNRLKRYGRAAATTLSAQAVNLLVPRLDQPRRAGRCSAPDDSGGPASRHKNPHLLVGAPMKSSIRADSDIISSRDTAAAKYSEMCLTMFDRLISLWRSKIGALSARTRRYTIAAALCAVVIPIVTLGTIQLAAPADSGIAGCAALSAAHQVAAADYPRIRSQFAGSQWPDLHAAGTSYVDLAVLLLTARGTDGYEAVWFYQRLATACARHGQNITAGT